MKGFFADSTITNDAPWVLTVGASLIDRVAQTTVKLGNGMEFYRELPAERFWIPNVPARVSWHGRHK